MQKHGISAAKDGCCNGLEHGIVTGNRSLYVCTALFALGTFGAQLIPVVTPTWLALAAGVCLFPCLSLPTLRPFVCFGAGILWALCRAEMVLDTEWPATLESRDVTLWGVVAGLPERDERYIQFDLDVERARFQGRPVSFDGRVRLRWYDPPEAVRGGLKAATVWRVDARLKQPHGYYNPGGFDYEAFLFREHIRAVGYVRESEANTRTGESGRAVLLSARQALRDRLDGALAGLRHPGLLTALALGDRTAISDVEWRTFRATGTNHLIAISGLHIGFVAGVGALLGMWAGRAATVIRASVSAPRVGAAAALSFAFLYAALSGFAVPAQRAFVMAAVFLVGVLCRRHSWNVRSLSLALLLVLILEPASVHDPGLWLSFCAVGLIIGWLARERRREHSSTHAKARRRYAGLHEDMPWSGYRRICGRIVAALKLQWVLSVALLPLVAAFFSVASLVAAPANTIAVPVVVFTLVPLCLAAAALAALGFPAGASWCLGLADEVIHALWTVLRWLGELRYAQVEVHVEMWQSLVVLAGILWLVLARRWWRVLGLAGAAVLFAPGPDPPARGEFQVAVLDVGQGLSTVVHTAQHTLVYDTGPRYPGGFSLADAVLVPYLRERRISSVDVLIISHGDNDHRGGFEDLRAAYPAGRILSSVGLPGSDYCVAGQHWQWDGVAFEVLHPGRAGVPPGNNASCVLRISGPTGTMLLTGDIESPVEDALVRRLGGRLRSDVLLVPHQGSETSSSSDFIDAVEPALAVVSAGYLNRYGHPRPAVVKRYRRRGIPIRNTADAGAIIIDIYRQGITVSEWRNTKPRYWLDRGDDAHGGDAI